MGVLLQNQHISLYNSINYTIEIHDIQHTGSAIDFDLRGKGFQLSYEGNGKRFEPIIGSKLSLDIVVVNETIDNALNEIINWAEGRFFVVVKRGVSIYWVGRLLYDEFSRQNAPYPYTFRVTATDGLAVLRNIEYATEKAYIRDSALNYIFDCLERTDLGQFFENEEFLITSIGWQEANQVIDTDALPITTINRHAFYSTNSKDVTEYISCYEILRSICTALGARLIFSKGAFRLIQVNELAETTVKEVRYKKDRTLKGVTPFKSLNVNINDINIKLGGGIFRYLAGFRKVILTYQHRASENLGMGLYWSNDFQLEYNLGEIDAAKEDTFLIKMNLNYSADYAAIDLKRKYHRWKLKIKYGDYYLKRNISFNDKLVKTVHSAEWVNEEAYYEVVSNIQFEDTEGGLQIGVTTPPFDTDQKATLTAQFEEVGTYNQQGQKLTDAQVTLDWFVTDVVIELLEDGETSKREDERTYEIENTQYPNNTLDKELTTIIGDGVNRGSLGRLQVFNGTQFVDSFSWTVRGEGDGLLLQELLIREVLRGRKKTVTLWETGIRSTLNAHEVLLYDGKRWVLTQGTFYSNIDEWKGKWFEIGGDTQGMLILPVKPQTPNNPTIGGGIGAILEEEIVPTVADNTIKSILDGIKNGVTDGVIEKDILQENIPLTVEGAIGLGAGDTGRIINPNTGGSELFEVVSITPSGLNVNHTFINDYPEGSFIIKDILTPTTIPSNQIAKLQNQSGTYTDVDFDLPTNSIDEKLYIIRAGRQVFENWDYDITNNGTGERRRINWKLRLFGENIFIKLTT